MKRIIVFGSNGMLGRYISTYFENQGCYNVVRLTRKDYDISKLTLESLEDFLKEIIQIKESDTIVNAAGLINQRGVTDPDLYYKINSYFPQYLGRIARFYGIPIIHASTDCVFSGKIGYYDETCAPDATDLYGFSKMAGENPNLTIIRCSIIGEELENKVSFLEFIRKNKNGRIRGYTNHLWNGITALQYAKVIMEMHENFEGWWRGVRHILSPESKTKWEIADIINRVYDLGITIEKFETPEPINKALRSIYSESRFGIPSLEEQITELKSFKLK